jgi:flavin-binding protein dodecin
VGFSRASKTLRGITGMRVMEQRVAIRDGNINSYRVKLEVIFILEEKYKIDYASTDEL